MKRRTEMVALVVLTVVFSAWKLDFSGCTDERPAFLPGDETEWKHSTG